MGDPSCINKNSELLQKCRHNNQYKLTKMRDYDNHTQVEMKDLVKLSETEASYIKEGQELDDGITTKAGKLIMKKWTHLKIQPTSLSAWPALIEQTAGPSIYTTSFLNVNISRWDSENVRQFKLKDINTSEQTTGRTIWN